jgi:hypothetical protein
MATGQEKIIDNAIAGDMQQRRLGEDGPGSTLLVQSFPAGRASRWSKIIQVRAGLDLPIYR